MSERNRIAVSWPIQVAGAHLGADFPRDAFARHLLKKFLPLGNSFERAFDRFERRFDHFAGRVVTQPIEEKFE
jgi:hypothetical protein